MSDETPPPALRLKPRQRSETETPAAAPAAAEADDGKLRLKPKLTGDTPESAEVPPMQPEPAATERIRIKPKLNVESAQADETPAETPPEPEPEEPAPPPPPMPEEGKIKLKIKLPSAAAVETAAPAEEAPPDPPSLPPFPVVVPPPPEPEVSENVAPPTVPPAVVAGPPRRGAPPPGGAPPAVFKRPRVPAALLAAERRKRMWKYVLIAVGGIFLAGAVIFGAFLKFTEPPPTPHIPQRTIAPPVAEQPAVETPLPNKPVVAPKVKAPAPVEQPDSGARVDSTATVELTPGVMATTESIKAVPNATSAFRTFVASAKISGVYQGTPPRAFINGRLFRTGELVDDTLEIYFDSVDGDSRSIIFKDSSGATVSRRY